MARTPGFSIAELLVVMALLSVLALAAVPMSAPRADKRLDAAAQEVIDALRFARIEAQRTGTVHGADFSVDLATGQRRVRVFRTDTAIPPNPVYDVRHPIDKKLYVTRLDTGTATEGVAISAATLYYKSGSTVIVRDWAAFDRAGTPTFYPDAATYAAHSQTPNVTAVTLTYLGRSVLVLVDPVSGRVTRT